MKKQKLELTWIGKENRPRLEPRILLEDPAKSRHAPFRTGKNDFFDSRLIFDDNDPVIKVLETTRNGNCRKLLDARGVIDTQRDELIGRMEKLLYRRHTLKPVFTFRWGLA